MNITFEERRGVNQVLNKMIYSASMEVCRLERELRRAEDKLKTLKEVRNSIQAKRQENQQPSNSTSDSVPE
jgi:hypothetical protein